jgi:hypothetical protein
VGDEEAPPELAAEAVVLRYPQNTNESRIWNVGYKKKYIPFTIKSESISSFTKTEMPLPLSLAFMGMKFAKQMHSAPVFKRPFLLRKIYYARFGAYVLFGVSSLIAFSNSSEASKGSSRS